MKYYKTWQEAFIDFIKRSGNEFDDSYNLTAEFEYKLGRNVRGTYYIKY
jgi:hypothetical protein